MENKHLADGLIVGLRQLATKLEQFQVDVALGKADAKDKINEYRTEIKNFSREAKFDIMNGTSAVNKFKADVEELAVQAELGKAEFKEYFEEQKKKISTVINDVDTFLNKNLN